MKANLRERVEQRLPPTIVAMPLADYVRDPAPAPSLSASIAHLLLTRSPRHAWLAHPRLNPQWAPEEDERFDFGTIAHELLLEGHTNSAVVVDAPNWRKRAASEAKRAAR